MKQCCPDSIRSFKIALGMTAVLAVLSCASTKPDRPALTPEEYSVLNDFYQRAHRPLYHKTVSSSLPGTFSDPDSILSRKRYPGLASDQLLQTLVPPAALREIQLRLEDTEELYFDAELLKHIRLTHKKPGALTVSRPIVLDSIAVIRQIGVTNDPVFTLKKDPTGYWGLLYTFFEEAGSE